MAIPFYLAGLPLSDPDSLASHAAPECLKALLAVVQGAPSQSLSRHATEAWDRLIAQASASEDAESVFRDALGNYYDSLLRKALQEQEPADTSAPATPGLLEQALVAMNSRCDNATTKDGTGWTKLDAKWMPPYVSAASRGERIPDSMRAAVRKRLAKYSGQLLELGIDIVSLEREEESTAKTARATGTDKGPTVAEILLDIGAKATLFLDERGDAYAAV